MLFGVAGVPHSSKGRSTIDGVKTIKELGLDAMEVQFVRGVKMGVKTAEELKKVAEKLDVKLTVHAPYYINLNASDEKKFEESVKRIVDSCRIGSLFNARSVVFHAGYYMKLSKEKAYAKVKLGIQKVIEFLNENGIDIILRPETTGKPTQFGDLNEVVKLSQELERVLPCIDFSHIHARYRIYNSYDEFCSILEKVEEVGKNVIKNMHIHLSGIEYGLKGEKSHLNLKDSDMRYKELLQALIDFGTSGILICESPNLEEDALLLKKTYNELK
ncbi:hypothetical protein DRP05_02615 [Archaeoglobales archaeon]|nr:MAG: hypothetical protein DRP05_02615 [Archaeoglobales archaeon]